MLTRIHYLDYFSSLLLLDYIPFSIEIATVSDSVYCNAQIQSEELYFYLFFILLVVPWLGIVYF